MAPTDHLKPLGLGYDEQSWEPEEHVKGASEMVEAYEAGVAKKESNSISTSPSATKRKRSV
jgi:hypothetical protein